MNPEYRDFVALDFIFEELNHAARDVGALEARIDRSVLVERGTAKGISRSGLEVALATMVISETLVEVGQAISFARNASGQALPSLQLAGGRTPNYRDHVNEDRNRAYALVEDVIGRRTDGRPAQAEPLAAFGAALAKTGHRAFQLWWAQTAAELARADPQTTPVSAAVLAAALVEGALTFAAQHARSLGLRCFATSDFDAKPSKWRIEKLLASAGHGGEHAVLDASTIQRAETLARVRQRIHAGRMLGDFPQGVPDLRPEEARDAKSTVELVTRRVLDWLDRLPSADGEAR